MPVESHRTDKTKDILDIDFSRGNDPSLRLRLPFVRSRIGGDGGRRFGRRSILRARNWGNRGGSKHLKDQSQKSVVKVRYMKNFGTGSWGAHGRYLSRKGAQQENTKGQGFNAERDDVNLARELSAWEKAEDQQHFRIMISPENGERMDLREHVRAVVVQMQTDLGEKLQWAAIDHYNTDNPHVHLLVRGVRENGEILRIAPDYIKRGIREISKGLATQELGYRTERDNVRARERVIQAYHLTAMDKIIEGRMNERGEVTLKGLSGVKLSQTLRRLQHLQEIGLASKSFGRGWVVQQDIVEKIKKHQVQKEIEKVYTKFPELRRFKEEVQFVHLDLKEGDKFSGILLAHGYMDEIGTHWAAVRQQDERIAVLINSSLLEKKIAGKELQVNDKIILEPKQTLIKGEEVRYMAVDVRERARLSLAEIEKRHGEPFHKKVVITQPSDVRQKYQGPVVAHGVDDKGQMHTVINGRNEMRAFPSEVEIDPGKIAVAQAVRDDGQQGKLVWKIQQLDRQQERTQERANEKDLEQER